MDASVNMKMTPNEHRTLVSAVEESLEIAQVMAQMKVTDPGFDSHVVREARERATKLNDLRQRL